jgi:hypothetical protein
LHNFVASMIGDKGAQHNLIGCARVSKINQEDTSCSGQGTERSLKGVQFGEDFQRRCIPEDSVINFLETNQSKRTSKARL